MAQLLAGSSLSCDLGLSLDLQLQSERLRGEKPVALDPPSSLLQHRVRAWAGAVLPVRGRAQGHQGLCWALSHCPVPSAPCC